MKNGEIWELNVDEIEKSIVNLKETLFNLRFQHEIGQLENTGKILYVKKDIAKLKTILKSKLILTK